MSDIVRVTAYVALLGAVLAAFTRLGAVVFGQILSGTSIANPMAALLSVLTLAGIGGAIGLGYGIVAGVVVAVATRITLPGRRLVAAAIVFAAGFSAIAERALALALAEMALPRLNDPVLVLAVRAVPASIVALVAWQEIGQREPGPVAVTGQAGRASRR